MFLFRIFDLLSLLAGMLYTTHTHRAKRKPIKIEENTENGMKKQLFFFFSTTTMENFSFSFSQTKRKKEHEKKTLTFCVNPYSFYFF
jgi:hypothetical protein